MLYNNTKYILEYYQYILWEYLKYILSINWSKKVKNIILFIII